jgi:hypothetical protein
MLGVALGLAAIAAQMLQAGERTNIQGVGMARTHVAVSRGIDAIGSNPANLAAPDDATVTIALLPLGVHVGNNVFSYDFYTKYFEGIQTDSGKVGVNLNDADKRDILGRFADGLGEGVFDLEAREFGIAVNIQPIGAFAFTLTDRLSGSVTIPREYVEFLFYGNPPNSSYDFARSGASVAWTREYALSYARALPPIPFLQSLRAGISLKLVHGLSYFGVDRFNARLVTSPVGVLDGSLDVLTRRAGLDPTSKDFGSTFTPFPAPAGVGYGVDLGVTGELNELIRAGLSITDIGSIDWRGNLVDNVAGGTIHLDNPLDPAQRDSLNRALKGQEQEGHPFSTSLPTTLRLGVAVELHKLPFFKRAGMGELTVAADFHQGLVKTPGGTTVPRGSFAFEYRPWRFLPIRSGIAFGGPDGATMALGLGFHFGVFELDLATENLAWIVTPSSAEHGSGAMGMRIRL